MPHKNKEARAKYMRDYRALRKPSEASVNPSVNPVNPVEDSSASISDTVVTPISDTVNPVYFKYGGRDLGEIYDTCKEEFHRDIEEQATLMEVLANGNR